MVRVNTDSPARLTSTLLAALALTLAATPAQGQRTAADSLAERLRRAEAAIAALQTQVAEQAQGGVTSRSGARVELTGRVLMKAFGNSHRVNNVDNPQFAVAPAAGSPDRGVGMAIRESRLGLVVTVPEALGGSFTGDVDVDFYGGQMPSSGGRTFPLIRLRTARGVVRWAHHHVLVGQESPLVSGLNPVTVAAIGTPAFATSGNLWLWLPQVRYGVDRIGSEAWNLNAQLALLAPTSGDAVALFETDYDLAERTSRPFYQARVSARNVQGEMTREIGCGVHGGWLESVADHIVRSQAFACDALIPIVEQIEIRGEYFTGQGLRGLGGGGIGQNFVASNEALETKGGWAQINVRATPTVRLGVGCGGDHPSDLAPLRRRNDACMAHALVRPAGPMFLGVEARRARTTYASGRFTNDHVTLGIGFEF